MQVRLWKIAATIHMHILIIFIHNLVYLLVSCVVITCNIYIQWIMFNLREKFSSMRVSVTGLLNEWDSRTKRESWGLWPYGLASKFTHRRGLHVGRQWLTTLCYTRVILLGASNTKKFYFPQIVAPAMAGVAGALSPAMWHLPHSIHTLVWSLGISTKYPLDIDRAGPQLL